MADENEIYQKKNSFILYKNYINSVSKMSNEQAGELFKIILHYANTGELLESEDPRVDTALDFIGERLEFDMQKYLDTCEKRKAAGAKGGSSSKKEQDEEAADQKQTNANAKTNKQTKANEKEKSKTKQTQAKFPILILILILKLILLLRLRIKIKPVVIIINPAKARARAKKYPQKHLWTRSSLTA